MPTTMRFKVSAVEKDNHGEVGLYSPLIPEVGRVFYDQHPITCVNLDFVPGVCVGEFQLDFAGSDDPIVWGNVQATPRFFAFLDSFETFELEEIELHINTAENGRWDLNVEAMRTIDLDIVEGRPVFKLTERRLEPLVVAA